MLKKCNFLSLKTKKNTKQVKTFRHEIEDYSLQEYETNKNALSVELTITSNLINSNFRLS